MAGVELGATGRSHVIYNNKTEKYVMWYRWYLHMPASFLMVAVADHPDGQIHRGRIRRAWVGLIRDRLHGCRFSARAYSKPKDISEKKTWDSQVSDLIYLKESDTLMALCDQWWIPDKETSTSHAISCYRSSWILRPALPG